MPSTAMRNLVAALYDAKAVTENDIRPDALESLGLMRTDTPGRRLLQAIQEYTDDQVAARCKRGPEGCRKPK